MAFDYKKEYKEFYMPKKKPGIVEIPKMNYIAVRGKGNPNEENGEYKMSIGLLYGIAFTIKMSYKGTHKIEGNIKYYDLIENCIPDDILKETDPYPCDLEHRKWRVLQRIGSLGLLWNRASDAWLGIAGLKANERNRIFTELLSEALIIPVKVEDMKYSLYCLAEDAKMIDFIKGYENKKKRCEFIAPLDNMMWDRNLVKAIWDFDYKWEIYTPQSERKYGYYVLPILYGEKFIGRIEMTYDKKSGILNVSNIWYEPKVKLTKTIEKSILSAAKRFERFNKS